LRTRAGAEITVRYRLSLAAELSCNVSDHAVHRIEILRNNLVIFHGDPKVLLEVCDELKSAGGIDYIALERFTVTERFGMARQEIVDEKGADVTVDVCGVHFCEGSFAIGL